MADPITLRVLTDAGLAIEDQAVSVIAPGEVGYLGVLHNHAPLITRDRDVLRSKLVPFAR